MKLVFDTLHNAAQVAEAAEFLATALTLFFAAWIFRMAKHRGDIACELQNLRMLEMTAIHLRTRAMAWAMRGSGEIVGSKPQRKHHKKAVSGAKASGGPEKIAVSQKHAVGVSDPQILDTTVAQTAKEASHHAVFSEDFACFHQDPGQDTVCDILRAPLPPNALRKVASSWSGSRCQRCAKAYDARRSK